MSVKFIKLWTDLQDNKKIKLIRARVPGLEGDAIILTWVELLVMAGKINDSGKIYIIDGVPLENDDLAHLMGRDSNIVTTAMDLFIKFKMIELDEDGVAVIRNWYKYQSEVGLDKIREQTRNRVQDHRDRKRRELAGDLLKCEYCGKDSDTVDHIIPKVKGGQDVPGNVVRACKTCNSTKHDKDLADFLNSELFYRVKPLIDLNLILRNEKLMQHVSYIDGQFVTRYGNVTVTDIDKDLDIDKDKDKERDKEILSGKPPIKPAKPANPYAEIIDFLNETCGTKYKSTSAETKRLIDARFNAGFVFVDFKDVIEKKHMEWSNDPEMILYLRPATLFGTKFESYLNQPWPRGKGPRGDGANGGGKQGDKRGADYSEFLD